MLQCSKRLIICNSRFCSTKENLDKLKFLRRLNLTLNLLSCKTFLIATSSPLSHNLAWKTTPKLPFPMTFVSEYETSWGRSGPWPGVATTVVTFDPSLPAKSIGRKVFELNSEYKCNMKRWRYQTNFTAGSKWCEAGKVEVITWKKLRIRKIDSSVSIIANSESYFKIRSFWPPKQ